MHPLAAAFASVADAYERGRPEYPAGVVAVLRDELGLGPRTTALDLAAGTGKLTRAVTATGARVVAIEPLAALRERIDADVVADGTAEATGLGDASVDAATVGDAWHWFDAEAAARELRRVVRGRIAVLWQMPTGDDAGPWAEAVGRLVAGAIGGIERTGHPGFDSAGPTARAGPAALAVERHVEVPFVHRTDRAGLVAQVASVSFVAALEAGERTRLLDAVADVVPDVVAVPYRTDVWICSP